VHTVTDPTDLRALESLLAFWRDAGVDVALEDAPVDRTLAPPKAEVKPLVAPGPIVRRGPDLSEALVEARRAATAASTLDELKAAIEAFDCPLRHDGARQAVFARGNPQGEVLVIGEAPGADEDREGAPFVGRAGKLLDRMLAAAGLTDAVFITNTVFWRPPGNRTPSPPEQALCAPFLERTIALVRPRVLLLVGAASAKSVLKRNEGILALRGNWSEWRAEEGELVLPALPTLHPAFLLRQPPAKKKAWADLLSLSERVDRLRAQALQGEM
jgi:DNA polymerase